MSKVLIIGDVHFSTYSSILRSRGNKYSTRLENLICSINWAESIAETYNVERVIYLGDFFDKPDLTAEEISALNEIAWANKPHYFIVGNHEANTASLAYNSTNALRKLNFDIIDNVSYVPCGKDSVIYFLPYQVEDNRKTITELNLTKYNKTIICSHNDIKGIQYGSFESKIGYDVTDIENNCDLFINGHLHNGEWITKKIRNLGNLTGQNFSEDAFKYKHKVMILDVDTLEYEDVENIQALNFYKLDLTKDKNYTINGYSVVAATCLRSDINEISESLKSNKNILAAKITTTNSMDYDINSTALELTAVDHLKQFTSFITDTLGSSDIVLEELGEVCK